MEKTIRDTRDQLLELKLRKQTGQVENTAELTQRRRDIARMETIRNEKVMAEKASA
ncbi:MAG: 50S ribosomal protein L29 [Opitutales bacterium]|nr:50S ribosomal protein L29 [Opitutales bacterium]